MDEAHGAHFHFSNYFPTSAAELGADLVIQSFHKTLPAMTQTAVLHNCSDRVDSRTDPQIYGNLSDQQPVVYSDGEYGCLYGYDGIRRKPDVS